MRFRLALVVLAFMVGILSRNAFADLIFVTGVEVQGTGLGAVNTLVTVEDPGGPGNQNGIESGCINQDGSLTPCMGIEGGDNLATNNVITYSNNTSFAAVVNINETGQDLSATLTDLYLTFVGSGGSHTAFYNGIDLVLTSGEGTGTGGSGFVFALNPAEFALVSALGPTLTISGGVQFASGTTNAGHETVYVVQLESPSPVIPEPASLLLLGTGLALVGLFARRRTR